MKTTPELTPVNITMQGHCVSHMLKKYTDIENMKETQTEFPGMKTVAPEMNNTLDKVNGRLDIAEEG